MGIIHTTRVGCDKCNRWTTLTDEEVYGLLQGRLSRWKKEGEKVYCCDCFDRLHVPRLCFVRGCWAYFTTHHETQTGENWDLAPHIAYAGLPHDPKGDRIVKVAFECESVRRTNGDLRVPAHLSVSEINRNGNGWRPWLYSKVHQHGIHAGSTIEDFVGFIQFVGGKAYVENG